MSDYTDKRDWYMRKKSDELNYILRNITASFNRHVDMPYGAPERADDRTLESWSVQYNTIEEILLERDELER